MEVPEISKKDMKKFVRKVIKNNPWINGNFAASDGDVMAVITYPEEFKTPVYAKDLRTLYEWSKNGLGTFVWRNVVIFNHPVDFGTFVYRYPKYDGSVEHLTVNAMTFDEFADIIQRISDESYWHNSH